MENEIFNQINELLINKLPNIIKEIHLFNQQNKSQENKQKAIQLRDEIASILQLCQLIEQMDSITTTELSSKLNEIKLYELITQLK